MGLGGREGEDEEEEEEDEEEEERSRRRRRKRRRTHLVGIQQHGPTKEARKPWIKFPYQTVTKIAQKQETKNKFKSFLYEIFDKPNVAPTDEVTRGEEEAQAAVEGLQQEEEGGRHTEQLAGIRICLIKF